MSEPSRAQRRRALRELYARVPRVECKGLCAESCGPIECSDLERDIVEARAGKRLTTRANLDCSMLSPAGRCTVYGDRPLICRMWGAVPEMPCPHGCRVINPIRAYESFELMHEAFRLGGGRLAGIFAGGVAELRERMADPNVRLVVDRIVARGQRGDKARMAPEK